MIYKKEIFDSATPLKDKEQKRKRNDSSDIPTQAIQPEKDQANTSFPAAMGEF